jgi:hypothetical protein
MLMKTQVVTVADAIENALEWLDRQGCIEPMDDRRGSRRSRYRATAEIAYKALGGGHTIQSTVHTRNLSRTGLNFVSKSLLYPRQLVDIQLPMPDKSVSRMRGRVVRVKTAGTAQYEISVEFTEMTLAVC